MDVNRVRRGELIAGVGGIALLLIMFVLTWFSVDFGLSDAEEEQIDVAQEQAEELGFEVPDVGDVSDSVGLNAFESFGIIDLVLLLTVIAAVGVAVATAMARDVALPVAASALTAGLGILSVVLIAYRILDPPGGLDRSLGVFLGLIAAAAVAYGGWMSMQDEGTSFSQQADGLQDRYSGDDAPPPPPPPPAAPASPPPPPPPATGPGA